MQDETNPGNFVIFNPVTGDYQFYCNGVLIASGTGTPHVQGCAGTVEHPKGDRRVLITFDLNAQGGKGSGTAFLQRPPNVTRCSVFDKDLTNNNCAPAAPIVAPERGREREP